MGCATEKTPLTVLHGSRADGLVTIGYMEQNTLGVSKITPDFLDGRQKASNVCSKWGYAGAVELDENSFIYSCNYRDDFGICYEAQYSKIYQCVGSVIEKVNK